MTKTDSLIGCIVSKKGVLPEISYSIKLKTNLFKQVFGTGKHEPVKEIKPKEFLMLNVNTTTSVGVVKKVEKDLIELNLNLPVVALSGDNVGIARNLNNHWRLIGFGEIVEN